MLSSVTYVLRALQRGEHFLEPAPDIGGQRRNVRMIDER